MASVISQGWGKETVKKAVFIGAFLTLHGSDGVGYRIPMVTWQLVHRVIIQFVNMILNLAVSLTRVRLSYQSGLCA